MTPSINLTWVPVNTANVTGQIASAIAKVNGLTPSMTTGFTPPNTMAKTVNSAVFATNNYNLVYRFTVETICTLGGPTLNDNGVREEILFACQTPNPLVGDTTQNTINARVFKNLYNTSIDGNSYPNGTSSIEGVEFSLYNATNTTLIQGAVMGSLTGTGSNLSYTHRFLNLQPSTTYTIRYVLFANVNNVIVRSDVNYLHTFCTNLLTTTAASTTCLNCTFQNPDSQIHKYRYTSCTGVFVEDIINPGNTIEICALQGSTSADPGVIVGEFTPC